MNVKSESEVTQSCPTLSDPMDCSLPGCSVHGIFQARVLEWGAIAFSSILLKLFQKVKEEENILQFILSGYLYIYISTIKRHYRKLQIIFLMNMVEKNFQQNISRQNQQSIKDIINDYHVALFQRCKDG